MIWNLLELHLNDPCQFRDEPALCISLLEFIQRHWKRARNHQPSTYDHLVVDRLFPFDYAVPVPAYFLLVFKSELELEVKLEGI